MDIRSYDNNTRVRNYCFTINNPDDNECFALHVLKEDSKVTYLIVGEEVGDNGTEHYQGYIEFNNPGMSQCSGHRGGA